MPIKSAKEQIFSVKGVTLCAAFILVAFAIIQIFESNYLERKMYFSEQEKLRKLGVSLNSDIQQFELSLKHFRLALNAATTDKQLQSFTSGQESERSFLAYRLYQASPMFPYMQSIEIIDTNGVERMVLKRNNENRLVETDVKKLKNDSHTEYFKFAETLQRGQVGLYQLTRNKGQTDLSNISAVLITPIMQNEQLIGYLLYNANFKELFDWSLRHYEELEIDLDYIIYNSQGTLLYSQNPSKAMAINDNLNVSSSLSIDKPAIWKKLTSKQQGSISSTDFLYRFHWLNIAEFHRVDQQKNRLLFIARVTGGLDNYRANEVENYKNFNTLIRVIVVLLSFPLVFLFILWRSSERLHAFASAAMRSMSPLMIINHNGKVIDMNDSYCHRLGANRTHILRTRPPFIDGKEGKKRLEAINQSGRWSGEYTFEHQGVKITELLSISRMSNDSRNSLFICSFVDISAQKKLQDDLSRLSLTDSLTNIANRRAFEQNAERLINQYQRHPERGFCFVIIDIDHFKKINDQHGHDVGDQVLVNFAQKLAQHLRDTDFFARLGGEEFGILLSDSNIDDAKDIAERLRQSVIEDAEPVDITCSFGIVAYQADQSWQQMYKSADTALYRAKSEGRNRVEVA